MIYTVHRLLYVGIAQIYHIFIESQAPTFVGRPASDRYELQQWPLQDSLSVNPATARAPITSTTLHLRLREPQPVDIEPSAFARSVKLCMSRSLFSTCRCLSFGLTPRVSIKTLTRRKLEDLGGSVVREAGHPAADGGSAIGIDGEDDPDNGGIWYQHVVNGGEG